MSAVWPSAETSNTLNVPVWPWAVTTWPFWGVNRSMLMRTVYIQRIGLRISNYTDAFLVLEPLAWWTLGYCVQFDAIPTLRAAISGSPDLHVSSSSALFV